MGAIGGLLGGLFGSSGPSQQEQNISAGQSGFFNQLMANYSQYFGAQSGILGNLTNILSPIAQAGPNQMGFSAPELAALNTQANEGVGRAYAKADAALGTALGARGGGNEFIPNGAANELHSELATKAADTMSNEGLGITEANYEQGRKNWSEATGGLQRVAAEYDPATLAKYAGAEGSSAFGSADKVSNETNAASTSLWNSIGGLAGMIPGLAGTASSVISAINPNADTGILDSISG
jgi:hypothetical protein